jgi:plastocyanin
MIARAILGVTAAFLLGCGPAAGPSLTAAPNSPTIEARALAFDRESLAVPAGAAFTLVFDNREAVPHNIAIYRDASGADRLFGGDVVTGPTERVYAVPALPAGTWYFRCDVHPAMHGELTAGP